MRARDIVSATYTAVPTDAILKCNAVNNAIGVTLYKSIGSTREIIITKNDTSTNAITITPATGDTIDGASTATLTRYGQYVRLQEIYGGWTVADASDTCPVKKVTGSLAAVDTGGGIFSWQNPEPGNINVIAVNLIVTTKTTGACAVDVGTTATNATTSSDNLIDGKDINAATGTFDNIDSAGTNGKAWQRLASGKWVTASVSGGGASAGLVGTYAIYYMVL